MAKAKKTVMRREYTNADVKELRAHSKAKTPVRQDCEAHEAHRRFVAAEGDQAWDQTRPSSLGPLLIRYKRKCGGETEPHMTLLSKVFSTRTLVQIICVLGAVVVMKALSAHYDFSWAAALAAE